MDIGTAPVVCSEDVLTYTLWALQVWRSAPNVVNHTTQTHISCLASHVACMRTRTRHVLHDVAVRRSNRCLSMSSTVTAVTALPPGLTVLRFSVAVLTTLVLLFISDLFLLVEHRCFAVCPTDWSMPNCFCCHVPLAACLTACRHGSKDAWMFRTPILRPGRDRHVQLFPCAAAHCKLMACCPCTRHPPHPASSHALPEQLPAQ